jgi:hypothetical protein
MSVADVPLGPITSRCAAHPEEAASGTCSRCGTFFCAACQRLIFDKDDKAKAYCAECARRPDINYLELFRLKLWGRRDAWAWVIGLYGLGLTVFAGVMLVNRQYVPALATGACAGVCMAFFLGVPWARQALILTPPGVGAVGGALGYFSALALPPLFLIFFAALFAYVSPRSQLFFRQEVSVPQLHRLWHQREDNPLARHAMSFALGGLFLPLFAPVAIVLGVEALRRVNPDAMPPVGRRGQSLAAVVLGFVITGTWLMFLWPLLAGFIPE